MSDKRNKQRYKGDVNSRLRELENELEVSEIVMKQQRNAIKRLLILLIENDIPIPKDLIDSYILKEEETSSSSFEYDDDDLPFY